MAKAARELGMDPREAISSILRGTGGNAKRISDWIVRYLQAPTVPRPPVVISEAPIFEQCGHGQVLAEWHDDRNRLHRVVIAGLRPNRYLRHEVQGDCIETIPARRLQGPLRKLVDDRLHTAMTAGSVDEWFAWLRSRMTSD